MPVRARTWLRLGHASLGAGAYRDAADAFEAVVSLEPEGERGREALSLLTEAYSRTGNTPGLYRTSLQLARKAETRPTAEVLYRRAADLFDDPKEAIDALLPLTQLRPADATVIDRAVEGLRALGRHGELLDVYEAGAKAAGGPRAAELLLAAATVAEPSCPTPERAWDAARSARRRRTRRTSAALRKLVEGLRQRGDAARLLEALQRLVTRTEDADEASLLRLELASLAQRRRPGGRWPARCWRRWWRAEPRALATPTRWRRWSRCSADAPARRAEVQAGARGARRGP